MLERITGRAASDGTPVSVALVDLDHFKRVNDVHGHRVGDDVLRRFAEVVALGEPTLAGRWGGEEFLVAFDGVAAADAVERVELVLDAFRNRSFVDADGVTFTCTFSAGIAEFPIEATTVNDLLRRRRQRPVRGQGARPGAGPARRRAARQPGRRAGRGRRRDRARGRRTTPTAIADALSRDGWHVVSLGDGHEAVRRLVGPLADLVARLVVLDADADGLDAVTVLHRLKRAGVPSEVLVAARTPDAAAEAVSVGAAGAVPKPLVPDHVSQVVGEALARLGHHRNAPDAGDGRQSGGARTTRTPSRRSGRSGPKRSRTVAAIAATTSASVVGPSGSLAILERVQNVAVRTFTATWVTARPAPMTSAATSRASRSTWPAMASAPATSVVNVSSLERDLATHGSATSGLSSPPSPRMRRWGPIVGPKWRASSP